MYQQGYRPEPPQKRQGAAPGSQKGYTPPNQQAYFQPQAAPVMQNGYRPQGNAPAPKRRSAPKAAKKKNTALLVKFLAAIVLIGGLCGAGYYYYVSAQVTPYDTTFCHGVYVDGIHLGGLTAQEGYNQVTAQAMNRQMSWNVKLMYGEQTAFVITSDLLDMEIKVDEVLKQAWQLGRGGNVFEKKAAQENLKATPQALYTVVPSANTAVIDGILQDIRTELYRDKADAKIISFDPVAQNPFTYQQEVIGRQLDTQRLKERIYEMVATMEAGELQIEPTPIYPSVTVADLMEQTTLIATAVTDVDRHSTVKRTNNIRRAFELISGKVLKPGERFSFNAIAGKRELKNGYFEAIEYAYGMPVEGVGGGVCQASTTIYLAALMANLEIVKREPHSDSVTYTSYGQDATVSMSGKEIDFVFKNNTEGTIYICAAVQTNPNNKNEDICKVRIYGPSLGNVSYKVESTTIETLRPSSEIIYDPDTKQEKVKYTDQTAKRSPAKNGCVVETYLNKIIDNRVVERTLVSTDTYPAKKERQWVGTQKR
jgi:Uncharacterized vancomycin resistance protein